MITVSTDEDRELSVKKWVAVELGEYEERLGILDYPFEDSGSPLSTTVNSEGPGDRGQCRQGSGILCRHRDDRGWHAK